jgi:uncharacterized protein (DUF1684 family)
VTRVAVPAVDPFAESWEQWRAARLERLNAVDGPPTLTATYWLDESDVVPGVAGRWSIRDGAVVLTPDEGEEIVARAAGQEAGAKLRLAGVSVQVIARDGRTGVRVFDHAKGGAIRDVETFPPSPSWVVAGRFTPVPGGTSVAYQQALESAPRELTVPGVVSFELDGRRYETAPLREGDALLLVFADATTGTQSKPPARFLWIELPNGPNEASDVEIDFNRAYLPPCAFSDEFNCPLPPAGHRIAAAVTAGETWAHRVSRR